MDFTRTDANALLAIAIGGAVGIAAFGPQMWTSSRTTTGIVTSQVTTTAGTATTPSVGADQVVDQSVTDVGQGILIRRTVVGSAPAGAGTRATLEVEPLVYIDGVRTAEGLPNLDPETIERIEVLKGEAAVELYGPEASAGVVQIFSKQPRQDPGG
jgi:outer membrane cobalamin receptor